MTSFVNVLLAQNTDRLFTYKVPPHLDTTVAVGNTIVISFRNRSMQAFVVEFTNEPDYENIKDIVSVLDLPLVFTKDQVQIAHTISDYYLCSFLSALYLFLPPGMDKRDKKINQEKVKFVSFNMPVHAVNNFVKEYESNQRTSQMAQVLKSIMLAGGTIPLSDLPKSSSLRTLIKKNIITIEDVLVSRMPENAGKSIGQGIAHGLDLTGDQHKVITEIIESSKDFFLLHGVTGSGKTEVYLRVIEHVLSQGKSAIVLVPEISLTPQTLARFYSRFSTQVAVIHSSLTPKERRRQWLKIQSGECRIVVGARSALFSPLRDLGAIIIDEEHESSYKQDSTPRYHAVTVAGWMAKQVGAKLILGSATPAVERYYFAQKGVIEKLSMPSKVKPTAPSEIVVVDMRKEQESGNHGSFSKEMVHHIQDTLKNGEQIMLLLNRRGFAPFVICKTCGHKLVCPHCEVTLTLHNDNVLYCHYCGYKAANKPLCPQCQSIFFRYSGVGTQKIEQELASFFPNIRVLRMDRDSTRTIGSLEAILSRFSAGEADILIGTQMIAKGHDFDNVGLVGVISADVALNLPDFRAAERTYTLLSQVAGRTGRRGKAGKVVVQTYNPDNYSISLLLENNYQKFYDEEIMFRQALDYPPFARLCRIIMQAHSQKALSELAEKIDKYLEINRFEDLQIFGPMPAPISKIAAKYRWHIIIKSKSIHSIQKVVKSLKLIFVEYEKSIKWLIDVDPANIL
ncbi:MAG TPA: primosomal protein N' [Candidatus Margulisbacteria bacterium]|nr:MAG: primosomal protein N' [Candidatus Margulisbacteria bacterium GWF2_38_17]OGI05847.1 MAG: primosomal protein N' [Candidatus Margulisbacteria bacterium GWE2_39_32]HCT86413.1 primosomal protein N' [Candidatus Margulisiibacteriota bacterium]